MGATLSDEARRVLEEYKRRAEEARELRRRMADWEFIERQPEPLRTALKILVETGDLWLASRVSGVPLEELNELRIRARIPLVVV